MDLPHAAPPRPRRRAATGAAALPLLAVGLGLAFLSAARGLVGPAVPAFLGVAGAASGVAPVAGEAPAPSALDSADGPCAEAAAAGLANFEPLRVQWESASTEGVEIRGFAAAAAAAESAALKAFDGVAVGAECTALREALRSRVREVAFATYQKQRDVAEMVSARWLAEQLYAGMRKRKAPLRTQEKLALFRAATKAYRARVKDLLPAFAAEQGDSEQTVVEQRLGEVQWGIESSGVGKRLAAQWLEESEQEILNRRAHGVSLSVDPGLRVMVRPEGMGNLQVFGQGPIGPPDHGLDMDVGLMNDGSMGDVYREMPTPPLFNLQPAVRLNVHLR